MSDARETAPESRSGEPLGTAPDDIDEAGGAREPYDADGAVEPERGTPVDDDDIMGESRPDRPR